MNPSVKYVGFYSWCVGVALVTWDYWRLLADRAVSNASLVCQAISRIATILLVTLSVYLAVFFVHLCVLQKAGPHDSVMTSAFQASLEVRVVCVT